MPPRVLTPDRYAIGVREWSASLSGRITPWNKTTYIHCTGVCVGDRGGVFAVEKKELLGPSGERTSAPISSSSQPVNTW
jgi:hypothetical protein